MPGEHLLRVASAGEYELRLTPLGPPDPDAEREPNNDAAFAEPLRLSRERVVGRLPSLGDRDVFRFSLAGPERIAITATPPADGGIDLSVENRRTTTSGVRSPGSRIPSRLDLLLGPGDYEVVLANGGGASGSEGRYELVLERGDPLAERDDAEPNDIVQRASPIPPSLVVRGTGSAIGDTDWYALPPIEPGTRVRVTFTGEVGSAALSDGVADVPVSLDPTTGVLEDDGSLGATPRFLRVGVYGDYEAVLEIDGVAAAPDSLPLPVRMTVTPHADSVAAYWPTGQRLTAEVTLANAGWRPLDLALDTLTSHIAWSATLDETLRDAGSRRVGGAADLDPRAARRVGG